VTVMEVDSKPTTGVFISKFHTGHGFVSSLNCITLILKNVTPPHPASIPSFRGRMSSRFEIKAFQQKRLNVNPMPITCEQVVIMFHNKFPFLPCPIFIFVQFVNSKSRVRLCPNIKKLFLSGFYYTIIHRSTSFVCVYKNIPEAHNFVSYETSIQ